MEPFFTSTNCLLDARSIITPFLPQTHPECVVEQHGLSSWTIWVSGSDGSFTFSLEKFFEPQQVVGWGTWGSINGLFEVVFFEEQQDELLSWPTGCFTGAMGGDVFFTFELVGFWIVTWSLDKTSSDAVTAILWPAFREGLPRLLTWTSGLCECLQVEDLWPLIHWTQAYFSPSTKIMVSYKKSRECIQNIYELCPKLLWFFFKKLRTIDGILFPCGFRLNTAFVLILF